MKFACVPSLEVAVKIAAAKLKFPAGAISLSTWWHKCEPRVIGAPQWCAIRTSAFFTGLVSSDGWNCALRCAALSLQCNTKVILTLRNFQGQGMRVLTSLIFQICDNLSGNAATAIPVGNMMQCKISDFG